MRKNVPCLYDHLTGTFTHSRFGFDIFLCKCDFKGVGIDSFVGNEGKHVALCLFLSLLEKTFVSHSIVKRYFAINLWL